MEPFNPEYHDVIGVAYRQARMTPMPSEDNMDSVAVFESPVPLTRKTSLRQSIRERLPLRTLNGKGKVVKNAFSSLKAKLAGTHKYQIKRLDATSPYKSPKTPRNGRRQRFVNSPYTPENQLETPGAKWKKYRVIDSTSPISPMMDLRRSERISKRQATPGRRVRKNYTPRRFQIDTSPGSFQKDLNKMTDQFSEHFTAITSGMKEFEKMADNLSDSLDKQEHTAHDDSGVSLSESSSDIAVTTDGKNRRSTRRTSYLAAQLTEADEIVETDHDLMVFGESENLI
ncbi:uncharacterized protein LOC100378127 [Saccoglossus kowalevskii]|uniref:Uncharacterized protein LOC100378127 n=1 Tax=Saccoglossus kowalevskii TaxID=10224 RepID=A0ABM0GUM4_SACKO|nr:PREDICTED: uncharacterized protein LOC100378127 [Saccoglossus kowalevskii]